MHTLYRILDLYICWKKIAGVLKKLINRDGDAEEVCSFAHIEIIYIRLHEKKSKH